MLPGIGAVTLVAPAGGAVLGAGAALGAGAGAAAFGAALGALGVYLCARRGLFVLRERKSILTKSVVSFFLQGAATGPA